MKQDKKIKTRLWIKILLIIIILLLALFLYSRFWNTKGLKVKEIAIYDKNLNSNYNGLKIAHFSDIHYGRTTHEKDLNQVVENLNELNPDIIIFTGDLFDSKNINGKDKETVTKALNKLEARLFKFAVIGDYDELYLDTYKEILEKSNFILLDNEAKLVYDNNDIPINFIGITNEQETDDLYSEYFNITLMHKPDMIKNLQKTNIAFAGHSLGGQLVIPFIGGIVKQDGAKTYIHSYYKIDNRQLYISNGVGTQNFSFRLFNKPSISLYRLYQK